MNACGCRCHGVVRQIDEAQAKAKRSGGRCTSGKKQMHALHHLAPNTAGGPANDKEQPNTLSHLHPLCHNGCRMESGGIGIYKSLEMCLQLEQARLFKA